MLQETFKGEGKMNILEYISGIGMCVLIAGFLTFLSVPFVYAIIKITEFFYALV